jgi:hypothetical protein
MVVPKAEAVSGARKGHEYEQGHEIGHEPEHEIGYECGSRPWLQLPTGNTPASLVGSTAPKTRRMDE